MLGGFSVALPMRCMLPKALRHHRWRPARPAVQPGGMSKIKFHAVSPQDRTIIPRHASKWQAWNFEKIIYRHGAAEDQELHDRRHGQDVSDRWEAGASEMRPYQDGAYPPAEGSPKGRLRGVWICREWQGVESSRAALLGGVVVAGDG